MSDTSKLHQSILSWIKARYKRTEDIRQEIELSRELAKTLVNLPPELDDFVGREKQQEILIEWLKQVSDRTRTAPVTIVIYGMAGVGKSQLAIRVLNQLKYLFPDGQIYLDLHGSAQASMSAHQVLLEVLRDGFGLESQQIERERGKREAQYRSLMAKKRVVLLLDNAADEAAVALLCPPKGGSAVVVTSRQPLELDGESLELKPMEVGAGANMGEAETLLAEMVRQVSPNLVTDDLSAARQIVELCGRLPLGIRIAGATLKMSAGESKSLGSYHDQLAEEEMRISKLENEEAEQTYPSYKRVRASFNLSYRALTAELPKLLRCLGALPGIDFGLALAATVMETKEAEVEEALSRLIEAQMLELSRSRYQFHELIRQFAREKLAPEEQEKVQARALRWYCEYAGYWALCLDLGECRQLAQSIAPEIEQSAEELEKILPLIALHWFEQERGNWLAIAHCLHETENWSQLVELGFSLMKFLDAFARGPHWERVVQLALDAAGHLDDPHREALTLNNLGKIYRYQTRWNQAIGCYQQSLSIFRELGERDAESQILIDLGKIYDNQSLWGEAIAYYEQSLAILRELSERHREGEILSDLGELYENQYNWSQAIDCYEQSLLIFRELGERHTEGKTLNDLGNVYESQYKWSEAISYYEQSLLIFQQLGALPSADPQADRREEGKVLNNLGKLYARQKQPSEAISCYEESLQIFRELGALPSADPQADRRAEGDTIMRMGYVYAFEGNSWDEAISCCEQSLQIFRELGEHYSESKTLELLSVVYNHQRRWGEAIDCCQQSLQIVRELGARQAESRILRGLGRVYEDQKQWSEAIACYEQSLAICRELSERDSEAYTLNLLGAVYRLQTNWHQASGCYQQSLAIFRELGDRHSEAETLVELGKIYQQRGKLEQAIELWQDALTKLHRESSDTQEVRKLLQSAQGATYRWFILGAIVSYCILTPLLANQWLIILVSIGIGIIVFLIFRARRN